MFEKKFTLDYPASDIYSKRVIRRVQKELLKMALEICSILQNHDIPYFITCGTLLGAVRHSGFIPWDDDFDLFLFDDSYDEAIGVLKKTISSNLLVHGVENDPHYFAAWNRIINLNTATLDGGLYNPHNKILKYQCIGVDLYRLKKINENSIKQYKDEEALRFFERKKNIGLISKGEYLAHCEQLKGSLSEPIRASDTGVDVFMFMLLLKNALPINSVLPLKSYRFEGEIFYGPSDHDFVLKSLYGDYKKIPNFDQRRPHFKAVKFFNQ